MQLYLDDILPSQNPIQRGFTSRTSPSNGSLLLTEAIGESLDKKQELNVFFVDATQAFDRVWHDSVLVKLYDVCLNGRKWLFLNNWYEDLMLSYLSSPPIAVYVYWTQRLIDFTIEIIKCTMLHYLQDVILNMLFVHLSIPNLIILGILLKFLSLIKELTLMIYQAYSRINQ